MLLMGLSSDPGPSWLEKKTPSLAALKSNIEPRGWVYRSFRIAHTSRIAGLAKMRPTLPSKKAVFSWDKMHVGALFEKACCFRRLAEDR